MFPLVEGLRELNVLVWNSNTVTLDDFIGEGKYDSHPLCLNISILAIF